MANRPSRWIWIPYIWLLLASTRSLDIWLSGGNASKIAFAQADLYGDPINRALLTLLIILSLFVLNSRAERTKEILSRNKWLLVFFLYMGMSVVWSNFPGISLRRYFRSVGTVVVVLVALTEHDPLEAIRVLLRRLYLVTIPLSIIAIKYFRNIGVSYDWSGTWEEWTGLSRDKNELGQVAMCSGLFWLWQILRDWPKKKLTLSLLLLAMSLWLLRGSKNVRSMTSIVGFIACFVILLGLQYIEKRTARAKIIILAGAIAFSLLAPFVYFVFEAFNTTPVEMAVQATGRDMTLTDRTLIWTDVLNDAAKSPVLGVGVGAFWVGQIGYNLYPLPNWSRKTPSWRPEEGHNGYIDVYVELGVIGVVLLLIVIGGAFAGAFSDLQTEFQLGSLRLTLLFSIVINNITETSFLKGTHMLWFLFLLVAINVPKPRPRVHLQKAA